MIYTVVHFLGNWVRFPFWVMLSPPIHHITKYWHEINARISQEIIFCFSVTLFFMISYQAI